MSPINTSWLPLCGFFRGTATDLTDHPKTLCLADKYGFVNLADFRPVSCVGLHLEALALDCREITFQRKKTQLDTAFEKLETIGHGMLFRINRIVEGTKLLNSCRNRIRKYLVCLLLTFTLGIEVVRNHARYDPSPRSYC
ncbi:hypothetical protein F4860DRAFT_455840 [Xylaria cubensis]|nr:hypothetical protein F4860DRAFT_455840 [Xylaria cubensis]